MNNENLKIEINGPVATVIINRPKALNALNKDVLNELKSTFTSFKKDLDIRVVVLTGAGDKSFVAGADIKEMQNHNREEAEVMSRSGQAVFSEIENLGKPVIAAVNGFALGGGFELAMSCSFIVASESAKFGLPEVSLGLIPGYGGTQRLSRLIGPQKAKRLIFSAEMISAQMAYEWGIVTEVVASESLMEKSLKLAGKISRVSPKAIEIADSAMNRGAHLGMSEALSIEAGFFGQTFTTEDKTEGILAFIEKRKPQFTGK